MKKLIVICLLCIMSITFFTCGLANSSYLVRSFDINEAQSAPVGSPMIIVEDGMKNDVYKYKFNGHRRELVYSGMDGDVLQVTYREYNVERNGVFIKDGFTQHLKYDLTDTDIIQFRDTQIRILKVTSASIMYEVIETTEEVQKGLRDQELQKSTNL